MADNNERFFGFVTKTDTCWLWNGRKRKGYGYFKWNGENIRAHRYSYWLFKGKIPDGLQLDHLCRIRNCVNPGHLEAVTPKVNTLRSNAITAINARKTHCKRGHAFEGANTYREKNGKQCNTCRLQYRRANTAKAKEYMKKYYEENKDKWRNYEQLRRY